MNNWIADVVGIMHINKISNIDVANKLNVTPQYISMLLNGKKTSKNAEHDIKSALNQIIGERTSA